MSSSIEVNGPLIEHQRKNRACLNRKEAAEKLGVAVTTLYYIERGRKGRCTTQIETLRRVADLLGVEPESLTAARAAPVGDPLVFGEPAGAAP